MWEFSLLSWSGSGADSGWAWDFDVFWGFRTDMEGPRGGGEGATGTAVDYTAERDESHGEVELRDSIVNLEKSRSRMEE